MIYGNIVINKKKYNKQHIIPLEGVTIEDLIDIDSNKHGWLVKTPTKSFAVYAGTDREKQEWILHINRCIDDLLRRTGKVASSAHAAVWVPDTETKECMHCKKTQFTTFNRRHHCRNCGRVICGNCSKNKSLIPFQSSKPVRVCDTCFADLCHRRVSIGKQTATSSSSFSSTAATISTTNKSSGVIEASNEEGEVEKTTKTSELQTNDSSARNNNNNTSISNESVGKEETVSTSSQEDASSNENNNGEKDATGNTLPVQSNVQGVGVAINVTHVVLSDEPSTHKKVDSEQFETDDDSDDDDHENGNLNDTLGSLEISTTPTFYAMNEENEAMTKMSTTESSQNDVTSTDDAASGGAAAKALSSSTEAATVTSSQEKVTNS